MNYSNMDMIKLLISAANNAVERPSSDIVPHEHAVITEGPSTSNASFVCLVGTHVDN